MRCTDPPNFWMLLDARIAETLRRVAADYGIDVTTRDDLDKVVLVYDLDEYHFDFARYSTGYPCTVYHHQPRDIVARPGQVYVFLNTLHPGDMSHIWRAVEKEVGAT